jgi:chitin synthase
VVWVFESMHVVGLALLVFVVLPELDVVKGAMLTNCLCFIPAVLGMYRRVHYSSSFDFLSGVPHPDPHEST